MIRKSNEETLKEVIDRFIETFKLSEKLDEVKLADSWEQVTGPLVQKHTLNVRVVNHVLFVKLNSAVLRNELSYSKHKLVKLLNDQVGTEVIRDIVFT